MNKYFAVVPVVAIWFIVRKYVKQKVEQPVNTSIQQHQHHRQKRTGLSRLLWQALLRKMARSPACCSVLLLKPVMNGQQLPKLSMTLHGVQFSAFKQEAFLKCVGQPASSSFPQPCSVLGPLVELFPLLIHLSLHAQFPLNGLGAVYSANETEQVHAVQTDGTRYDVRLFLHSSRPARRGTEVDWTIEITHTANQQQTVVWRNTATFYYFHHHQHPHHQQQHQCKKEQGTADYSEQERPAVSSTVCNALPIPADQFKKEQRTADYSEQEQPAVSSTVCSALPIPADAGRRFAQVCGDSNPIHLYDWVARLFGFTRAIAHGTYIQAALLPVMSEGKPVLRHSVKYKKPVFLPSTVTLVQDQEQPTRFQVLDTRNQVCHQVTIDLLGH